MPTLQNGYYFERLSMNTKLKPNSNRLGLAKSANWSVMKLPNFFELSTKALGRNLIKEIKIREVWLTKQGEHHALELFRNGFDRRDVFRFHLTWRSEQ
jgi:hypothetical protein